jgi:perosamine synthetase
LLVIEDACESPLAKHNGKVAGTFGNCAVYGFYPNKQMTTGEGGMIITNDESLYKMCRSLRNQGRGDSMQWLSHTRLGYNYRISEMTAAIGLVQTKKLPYIIKKRQELAAKYNELFKDIPGITLPVTRPENEHTWFVYALRVAAEKRDALLKKLNEKGVQSKAYFFPCIHMQEFYVESFGYKYGDFPIAEQISHESFVLPFFTQMTDEQMLYVKETLEESIRELADEGISKLAN